MEGPCVAPFELDDMELQTVNRFNERFAKRRHRVTLDTLVDDWISLVTEVEHAMPGQSTTTPTT